MEVRCNERRFDVVSRGEIEVKGGEIEVKEGEMEVRCSERR